MAYFINLPTFSDTRGSLTVFEKVLPCEIKRAYWIYEANTIRGGHRHKKSIQALICLSGSCEIFCNDGESKNYFVLDTPKQCLIIEKKDWHTMDKFSPNSILLVLSSEYYDVEDYIDEPYHD